MTSESPHNLVDNLVDVDKLVAWLPQQYCLSSWPVQAVPTVSLLRAFPHFLAPRVKSFHEKTHFHLETATCVFLVDKKNLRMLIRTCPNVSETRSGSKQNKKRFIFFSLGALLSSLREGCGCLTSQHVPQRQALGSSRAGSGSAAPCAGCLRRGWPCGEAQLRTAASLPFLFDFA